jgi:choline dehydrogenase-like flavoprotein
MTAPIHQPKYALKDKVDFVIVGSGASGGILAKELSSNGFKVVVLEQGPFLVEKDFGHDEFKTFAEGTLVNHGQRQTFRATEQEVAKPAVAAVYGRMVGGGSVHFTANAWRFHEIDFNEASKKGIPTGTGMADWPITYADLEPYYTKVDWEIGISGELGSNPFEPFHSKPYPVPPMPVKSSGVLFDRGAKKLGYHPFPAPLAVLSEPHNGRNACMHCGFCEFFGCEMGAKSSTLASVIPVALKTGRCEIRPLSTVTRIKTDDQGRVTGVSYYDERKVEHFQNARAVILAANGAETPRLLFLSASARFPNGLANSSGKIGKYLMFNSGSLTGAVFDQQLNDYRSVAATRVMHDFYEVDPKHGIYGGGGMDARFDLTPIAFAQAGLPIDAPRWGSAYKAALRQYFSRTMFVFTHGTSLPLETNNITLDPTWKDANGLPALRITYKDHADDLKLQTFLNARAMEILDEAGAQKKWSYPISESSFAFHLLGTCRMGKDPKTSVINSDHRAHDVPNLFLCDGSSLVTSGRGQPTMTIMALAFRAADRITALAKRGEI